MSRKKCDNCGAFLKLQSFYDREDRKGKYSFCKPCMVEQGRAPDWPPVEKRGGGSLQLELRD